MIQTWDTEASVVRSGNLIKERDMMEGGGLPESMTELKHNACMIDEETVEIILLVDEHFGDKAKTALWLRTPNQMFGRIAPLRLMQIGRARKVLEFILNARHEGDWTSGEEVK